MQASAQSETGVGTALRLQVSVRSANVMPDLHHVYICKVVSSVLLAPKRLTVNSHSFKSAVNSLQACAKTGISYSGILLTVLHAASGKTSWCLQQRLCDRRQCINRSWGCTQAHEVGRLFCTCSMPRVQISSICSAVTICIKPEPFICLQSVQCTISNRVTVLQGITGPYATWGLVGAGAGLMFYLFGSHSESPISLPGNPSGQKLSSEYCETSLCCAQQHAEHSAALKLQAML